MAVPERKFDGMGTIIEFTGDKIPTVIVKPTVTRLREQLQARAEELRSDIAALSEKQAELALIERMLEVK